MDNKYLLSWCTDFHGELVKTWYNRNRLEKLFRLFQSWGMRRIYWIYTLKHEEGLMLNSLVPAVGGNARRTYGEMGDFLPAAVETAHKLGLEIYAVYKPFDLGYYPSFPFGSEQAKASGKLDSLSGKLFWVSKSLLELQDKRLRRHPQDLEACSNSQVGAIELRFDTTDQSIFLPEDFSLKVSDDNYNYRPYQGKFEMSVATEENTLVVRFDGLNISSPYFSVRNKLVLKDYFGNTLDKLVMLYSPSGEILPFTYGLLPRFGKHNPDYHQELDRGFIFDYLNSAVCDNALSENRIAIDSKEYNTIGFALTRERYIPGALSPAYPEVRQCWLKHVSECLKAGVDGVDLRVMNHNRSLEWERYGFEPPVAEEYRKRHGNDPRTGPFSTVKHRRLLGEFYTFFYREAVNLIRNSGKKAQIHIGRIHQNRAEGNRYMNFHWEWEKWIEENLMDEITLKDSPFTDEPRWRNVSKLSRPRQIPAYTCTYWKSVTALPDWRKRWRYALEESLRLGQSGYIFYESAMVSEMNDAGEITVYNPETPEILADFRKTHNIK